MKVVITYQYNGGYFCDCHKRDLFWKESAKEYASRFPVQANCVVRINPAKPEEAALFEQDQLIPIGDSLPSAVRSE